MSKLIDLTGQDFGYWHVLYRAQNDKSGKARWHCKCTACGTEKDVQGTHLRAGKSTNCGCIRMKKNIMNEQKLKIKLKQITEKIKPNPNNFIIIKKWNYRKIFLPNRNKIFLLISEYLDDNIPITIEREINNFININDI